MKVLKLVKVIACLVKDCRFGGLVLIFHICNWHVAKALVFRPLDREPE